MKKILFVLSVVLLLGSCDLVSLMSPKDVTYSVTGGTSASVSYLNEDGEKISKNVVTPWGYTGEYYINQTIGISSLGDSEITVSVKCLGDERTITSDELILIYIY